MPSYQVVKANEQGAWGINFLLYSTAGAGKTTLAASAVDSIYGAPLLIIDAEGGARVVSHRADIDVVSITDINSAGASGFGWERIKEVTNDLISSKLRHISGLSGRPEDAGAAPGPYKTVVIDNMSEMIDMCVRHVLRTISRNIEAKDRPDQNDWGKVTAEVLLFTRRMRDFARNSGCNVFFIAWEIADKNEQGQVIKNGLLFNPALARKIPGIVDMVGFLRVLSGGERELTFEPSTRTDAKFRRNGTEVANQIPDVMRWKGKDNGPIVDMLNTFKGGVAFPAYKYRKPTQEEVKSSQVKGKNT